MKGIVTNTSNLPVGEAVIQVEGVTKEIHTDAQGRYWRLLAPGTYKIRALAREPRRSSTFREISVPGVVKDSAGGVIEAARVDFVLEDEEEEGQKEVVPKPVEEKEGDDNSPETGLCAVVPVACQITQIFQWPF